MKKAFFVLFFALLFVTAFSGIALADEGLQGYHFSTDEYRVYVTVRSGDGDAEAEYRSYAPGDTVIIELEPDDDEYLDTIYVKSEDGDVLKVKKLSSDSYSFVMPDSSVVVWVYYDSEEVEFDLEMKVEGADATYLPYSRFDAEKLSYNLKISGEETRLYLYLKYYDDYDITVKYDGKEIDPKRVTSSYDYFVIPVDTEELERLTVKVEDGSYSQTYKFSLKSDGIQSAALNTLFLYDGKNEILSLSPAFSKDIYNYVATADKDVQTVTLYAAGDGKIEVARNKNGVYTYDAGNTFFLQDGLNEFIISAGGAQYYVNVYRGAAKLEVKPSTQYVAVDKNVAVAIPAYNINGNNFVKLRAVAALLNGTEKQFALGYVPASKRISISTGLPYSSVGDELLLPSAYQQVVASKASVEMNGGMVFPTGYNIDGNNYYLLRDIAALLDFDLSYSNTTIQLNTKDAYGSSQQKDPVEKSDFDFDFDVKIKSNDGYTYLDKKDFDAENLDYTISLDRSVEYLYLYVYCDEMDDYSFTVKYGDETLSKDDVEDNFIRYKVKFDLYDLQDINLTVKEDGNKDIYRFCLDY